MGGYRDATGQAMLGLYALFADCASGLLPVLAGAVDFDDATRHLPLGKAMQVYEDLDGSASIAQVSAPGFAKFFRPHHEDVLNAGYSTSVFWLKVELRPVAPPGAARGSGCWSWPIRRWTTSSCTCLTAAAYTAWRSAPAMPCPTTAGRYGRTTTCSSCSCPLAR